MTDALEIRQLIDNWVLWRDAGFWDRFATVWHADGWMTATWFQGPASRFIEVSRDGFERGVNILHSQGAHTSDIAGTRAIAQTKMEILQRAHVDNILVDVVVTGRFYDFLEKRPSPALGTGPSTALGTGSVSLKDIARTAAREAERELILRMLTRTRWNRKEAAEILGISYKALLYKIKENGLDKAS